MGAISVPIQGSDLINVPSGALVATDVQAAIDELEANKATAITNVTPAGFVNVLDYGASNSTTLTTLNGGITGGASACTLTDASTYAVDNYMAIPGAGGSGVELVVKILTINSDDLTFTPATTTTVSTGITVYHDDTQAFITALATGIHVYVPKGSYLVLGGTTYSSLDIATVAQIMKGAGRVISRIWSRGGTTNCVRLLKTWSELRDIAVAAYSTAVGGDVTFTSGVCGIIMGNPDVGTSPGIFYITVANVRTADFPVNLKVDNCSQSFLTDFISNNASEYGLEVSAPNPRGGLTYTNITCQGDGVNGLAAIYMTNADVSRWVNLSLAHFPKAIHMNCSTGYIAHQHFANVVSDAGPIATTAVYLEESGGSCYGHNFVNLHGFSISDTLPMAYIGAGVTSINFTNFNASGTFGTAMEIQGDNISVTGGQQRMVSGGPTTTSYDNFKIGANATNVTIQGVTAPKARYAVNIDNASSGLNITGNNFSGNSSGGITNTSGTGYRATSIIENNVGADDEYIGSVAATPLRVGQKALASGIYYLAIGTSSSADWKALHA
jgi:hypothetical protein